MTWWENFLMSLCMGLVAGALTCLLLGHHFIRERRRLLAELAKALGEAHDVTLKQFHDLQNVIWAAKNLDEVKAHLHGEHAAFVRSLVAKPIRLVHRSEDERST